MTAAIQASCTVSSAASGIPFSVTLGTSGGGSPAYGFRNSPSYGAISPGTFKGTSIIVLDFTPSVNQSSFILGSAGVPNTDATFRALMFLDLTGVWRTLLRSSAGYSSGGGLTTWTWAGVSNGWNATTPSPRGIIFTT